MTSDSRVFVFFAFLSFAKSFVVEQQTLHVFGVDLIHISMISDVKFQC